MKTDMNNLVLEVAEVLKRNGVTAGKFSIEARALADEMDGAALSEIHLTEPMKLDCIYVPPLGLSCTF